MTTAAAIRLSSASTPLRDGLRAVLEATPPRGGMTWPEYWTARDRLAGRRPQAYTMRDVRLLIRSFLELSKQRGVRITPTVVGYANELRHYLNLAAHDPEVIDQATVTRLVDTMARLLRALGRDEEAARVVAEDVGPSTKKTPPTPPPGPTTTPEPEPEPRSPGRDQVDRLTLQLGELTLIATVRRRFGRTDVEAGESPWRELELHNTGESPSRRGRVTARFAIAGASSSASRTVSFPALGAGERHRISTARIDWTLNERFASSLATARPGTSARLRLRAEDADSVSSAAATVRVLGRDVVDLDAAPDVLARLVERRLAEHPLPPELQHARTNAADLQTLTAAAVATVVSATHTSDPSVTALSTPGLLDLSRAEGSLQLAARLLALGVRPVAVVRDRSLEIAAFNGEAALADPVTTAPETLRSLATAGQLLALRRHPAGPGQAPHGELVLAVDLAAGVDGFHPWRRGDAPDPTDKRPEAVERWLRGLIDLARTNPLVRFRHPSVLRLRLDRYGLEALEDELASGASLELVADTGADGDAAGTAAVREHSRLEVEHADATVLARRLDELRRKSANTIEETGANNLAVAIGTVRWSRGTDGTEPVAPADDRTADFIAPVLLVPVSIEGTAVEGHRLRIDPDEDAATNASLIELLRSQFGFDSTVLQHPPLLEPGVDVDGLLDALEAELAPLPGVELTREAHLGEFQFAAIESWRDLRDEWRRYLARPTVAQLITPQPARELPARTGSDLDELARSLPLLADDSQMRAIAAALSGASFVLEGPPGTGKSQTIANLIALAASRGHRVLFVAEKHAALEIIEQQLDELGLRPFLLDLHGSDRTPRAIRHELLAAWSTEHEPVSEAVRDDARALVERHRALAARFEAETVRMHQLGAHEQSAAAAADTVAALERALDAASLDAAGRLSVPPGAVDGPVDVDLLAHAADALDGAVRGLGGTLTHRAWPIGLADDHPIDRAALETALTAVVRASTGEHRSVTVTHTSPNDAATRAAVSALLADAAAFRAAHTELFSRLRRPVTLDDVARIRQALEAQTGSRRRRRRDDPLNRTLDGLVQRHLELSITELRALVDELERIVAAAAPLVTRGHYLALRVDDAPWHPMLDDGPAADPEELARARAAVAHLLGSTIPLPDDDESTATWSRAAGGLAPELDRLIDGRAARAALVAGGFGDFAVALSTGRLQVTAPGDVLRLAVARARLHERLDAATSGHAEAAPFAHAEREATVLEFARVTERLRDLVTATLPARTASARDTTPSAPDPAATALRAALESRSGGGSIRRLVTAHGHAITGLVPITLASPTSVAQHLPASAVEYDLVIFDEASQIRVHDAIGAMGRARQVIIVGDSQQMPPTATFTTRATAREGDTDANADGALAMPDEESILTATRASGLPALDLLSHYRSRDAVLIAFSNLLFYGGRLTGTPKPPDGSSDALRIVRVDGTYDQSARTNDAEAEAIIAEIQRRLAIDPDASIGVVTTNLTQRNLILDRLDAHPDPRVRHALTRSRESLFVKPLENVQGDERDVILLSLTYGPDATTGRLQQRFGPLLGSAGHKRLNVAITRARRVLRLYTSFGSSELRVDARSSEGLRALRDYLRFVEDFVAGLVDADERRDDDDGLAGISAALADLLAERGLQVDAGGASNELRVSLVVSRDGHRQVGVLLDDPAWANGGSVVVRELARRRRLIDDQGWYEIVEVRLDDWLRHRPAIVDAIVTLAETAPLLDEIGDETDPRQDDRPTDDRRGPTTHSDDEEGDDAPVPVASLWAPLELSYEPCEALADDALREARLLDRLDEETARTTVMDIANEVLRREGAMTEERLHTLVGRRCGVFTLRQSRRLELRRALRGFELITDAAGVTFARGRLRVPDEHVLRRSPERALRNIDAIPVFEVENAMRTLLAGGTAIDRADLAQATIEQFGFQRLGARIRGRLDLALRVLSFAGQIVIDGDRVRRATPGDGAAERGGGASSAF